VTDLGRMRYRLQVQAKTDATDSFGQLQKVWSTIATEWAEIIPLAGREALIAQQLQASITDRIRLRRNPDYELSAVHQLVEDATQNPGGVVRTFRILDVKDVGERRVEWTVDALEIPGTVDA
jgi:head-tail adaptor